MGTDPSDVSSSSGLDDPAQMVSWFDAVEFCNALSVAEGLTPVYAVTKRVPRKGFPIKSMNVSVPDWKANGYRLPTEMGWIWAAIGAPRDGQDGSINTEGWKKPFSGSAPGAALDDYAWYTKNRTGTTHRVGTKLANECGLFDLSGNVMEWCWDVHESWPKGPLADFHGPDSGMFRVGRGGSWSGVAGQCSIDYRHYSKPEFQHAIFGFRVARP
jgi:formylglycine-generating enzyme